MQGPYEILAHSGHVPAVKFTPDGSGLFSAGMDQLIQLWSVPDWKNIQTIQAHEQSVNCLDISPDGKKLVSGSTDKTAKIWSLPDGKLLHTLTGHKKTIADIAMDRKGSLVATASYDSTVRLWDVAQGKEKGVLKGHQKNAFSLSFDPAGEKLASGGIGEQVFVWKIPSKDLETTLAGHAGVAGPVKFSPDRGFLLTIDGHGTLRLWDPKGWEPEWSVQIEAKGAFPLAFRKDGERFAVGIEHRVLIFNTEDGSVVQELLMPPKGVYALDYSPDGSLLAVAAADRKVRVWEV